MTGKYAFIHVLNLRLEGVGGFINLFSSDDTTGNPIVSSGVPDDALADILEILEEAVSVYKAAVYGSSSDDIPEKLKKTVVEPVQKFGTSASSEDAGNGGEGPVI